MSTHHARNARSSDIDEFRIGDSTMHPLSTRAKSKPSSAIPANEIQAEPSTYSKRLDHRGFDMDWERYKR